MRRQWIHIVVVPSVRMMHNKFEEATYTAFRGRSRAALSPMASVDESGEEQQQGSTAHQHRAHDDLLA